MSRRPRFASAAGRGRRRALAWAAVALLLSLALARLHDYRGWDATFYLAQTSSLVEDGNADLRNDLLHLQREPGTLLRALTTLGPGGAVLNTFAVGAPVLWLPAYVLARPLVAAGAAPAARWARPQLAALHLLSLLLMVWLLWVLDRWLRRLGAGRWPAAAGALALVLGTPLVVYGFRAYTGSHQASTVAVMLLLLATLHLGRRPTVGAALAWGVALGLVFLCRWQDAVKGVMLVVPLLELQRRGLGAGAWLRLAAAGAAGGVAVGGLQLHVWLLERGELFALPQGPGYLELASPELGRFLFSGLSGLLPWSPLFAVGFAGLLVPWRARVPAAWRWVALGVLLFDVYLNAAVSDWWGGAGYGARRMCSDVPLLALGLGNLAARRRLRALLLALLVLCCLWGAVTVNLRLHGLRDLGILVDGSAEPAPGAERETIAQPLRAEALEIARSWPLRPGRMSYFPGRWRPGRPLTAALGGLACLLAGWALSRARAPGRLGAALLAVLVLALAVHARLLGGERADAGDRRLWKALSRSARGRAPVDPSPAAEAALAGRADGFSDARLLLRAEGLRRAGRLDEARAVVARLRPYPFVRELDERLWLAPGERQLLDRRGHFHRVQRSRPEREAILARPVDLGCDALRLRLEVSGLPAGGARGRLLAWGRRGEPPLARVEVAGAGRFALETAVARREAPLPWSAGDELTLLLEWDPRSALAQLTVRRPDGDAVALVAPATAGDAAGGRFQVVTGGAPAAAGGPPPGTRFSDLRLIARRVCDVPAPAGEADPPAAE